MQAANTEQLLTPKAVASILGKSPQTVRRMVKQGTLPAIRIPRTRDIRFRPSAVEQLLDACTFTGTTHQAAA